MTLNQLLVIKISLYIVSYMNAWYARVSLISPPISDIPYEKTPIRYDPDIQYLEPCYKWKQFSSIPLNKAALISSTQLEQRRKYVSTSERSVATQFIWGVDDDFEPMMVLPLHCHWCSVSGVPPFHTSMGFWRGPIPRFEILIWSWSS